MIYKTQRDTVADHLQRVGSITPGEALDRYGIARLAARVNNLRSAGWAIETTAEAGLNRHGRRCTYARYRLIERPTPGAVEFGHNGGTPHEVNPTVQGTTKDALDVAAGRCLGVSGRPTFSVPPGASGPMGMEAGCGLTGEVVAEGSSLGQSPQVF